MPAGVVTLLDVRTAAKQRADMENSSFVSDSEWNAYIQRSYQELYGMLVQAFGSDYFVGTPFPITTDGQNYLYALPSDFFKLLGVDLKMGSRWVTLKTFPFTERNRHAVISNIPSSGLQVQVWYVPRLTLPTLDADTLDGVNGWEEYIIDDAAEKALLKEESDASGPAARKAQLKERIEEEADRRDAGSPARVADSQEANGYFPARFYGPTNLRYRLSGNNIWLNPDDGLMWGLGESW